VSWTAHSTTLTRPLGSPTGIVRCSIGVRRERGASQVRPWSRDTFAAPADAGPGRRVLLGEAATRPIGDVQPLRSALRGAQRGTTGTWSRPPPWTAPGHGSDCDTSCSPSSSLHHEPPDARLPADTFRLRSDLRDDRRRPGRSEQNSARSSSTGRLSTTHRSATERPSPFASLSSARCSTSSTSGCELEKDALPFACFSPRKAVSVGECHHLPQHPPDHPVRAAVRVL